MSGIKIEGFEELEDFLNDFELDPVEEKVAMKKGLNVIKEEVSPDIPRNVGELEESQKISVGQKNGVTTGEYSLNKFYAKFLEYGTSKSKKHVGFFSNAIDKAEDKAIEVLSKTLLK